MDLLNISPDAHLLSRRTRANVTIADVMGLFDSNHAQLTAQRAQFGRERLAQGMASYSDVILYGNADQVKLVQRVGIDRFNILMEATKNGEF